MQSREILWEHFNYEEQYATEPSGEVVMDPSGERILYYGSYHKLMLELISTGKQMKLADFGPDYACFLEDTRYVLFKKYGGDNSDYDYAVILDTLTGESLSCPFEVRHCFGLRVIDDDCFSVKGGNGLELLYHIVWKYEAPEPEDPELRARFDGLLRAAEAAEDPVEGLRLVDEALKLDGYENDPSAVRLRARIGSSLCRVKPLQREKMENLISPDSAHSTPTEIASKPTTESGEPFTIWLGETLLNTYRVDAALDPGGMGQVWKVHHSGWNVDMAMKRPKAEVFDTEEQKKLFTDECENWIKLGLHPNIVYCFYVREIDGVPCIFSEWMNNGDLERHITEKTLYQGTEEAVRERLLNIAIQFARGLRYAHEQGLIHRDAKPSNLLLSETWEAKVSDFGLAKARTVLMQAQDGGDKEYMTRDYCSPEQAKRRPLTPQTDIYSWAVSILEMYLGDYPWVSGPVAGSACGEYFAKCKERPIPEALQELLARCLEEEPKDRPKDFGEIEAALLVIYKAVTGEDYPRPEPRALIETADSLNNRALSFLDLGKPEEAERLWEKALEDKPDHPETIFNQALYEWRCGEINDSWSRRSLWIIKDEALRDKYTALLKEESGTVQLPPVASSTYTLPRMERMNWSEDGSRVCGMQIKDNDYTWIVWDLREGRCLFSSETDLKTRVENEYVFYKPPIRFGHIESECFAEYYDDFLEQACLSENESVYTYSWKEHVLDRFESIICELEETDVYSFRLSRDGRFLLVDLSWKKYELGKGFHNIELRTIQVVELDSGRVVLAVVLPEWWDKGRVFSELSPDNTVLAFSNLDSLNKFEPAWETLFVHVETGKVLSWVKGSTLMGFAQDGSVILCDNKKRLYFGGRAGKRLLSDKPYYNDRICFEYLESCQLPRLYWLGKTMGLLRVHGSLLLCDLTRGISYLEGRKRIIEYENNEVLVYRYALTEDERYLVGLSIMRRREGKRADYSTVAEVWDTKTLQRMAPVDLVKNERARLEERGLSIDEEELTQRVLRAIVDPSTLRYLPGQRAEYHLCRVEEASLRLKAPQLFEHLLRASETEEDARVALRCVEEAMALTGYENNLAAIRQRAKIGLRLKRGKPLRIVPTTETAPKDTLTKKEQPVDVSAISTKMRGALGRLEITLRMMDGRWESERGGEIWRYYTRWIDISKDGGKALIHTVSVQSDKNDYFSDPDPCTVFHGAAVLDTRDRPGRDFGEPIWMNFSFYSYGTQNPAPPDALFLTDRYETVMDPSGELLLTRTDKALLLSKTLTGERKTLMDGEFRFACFLEDTRFVLCQRKDNSVYIINRVTCNKISFTFRDTGYGAIRYINDDCFAIWHNWREELCWIVWDYEL